MLLPNTGSLLHVLRSSLSDTVLPALEKGEAQRQLKASLHLLGRLEKSWDLYGQHVFEDNSDIETTINTILMELQNSGLHAEFQSVDEQIKSNPRSDNKINGLNDPSLIKATLRNLQLQECLQTLEDILEVVELNEASRLHCRELLVTLFERMAKRDSIYVGDRAIDAC